MKAAIISFSTAGLDLGSNLLRFFAQTGETASLTRCEEGHLNDWTAAHFKEDALIFIGSCGIAVRAIAPLLAGKTSDPAVVVIDELGAYVVSLLSGHIGGANELTSQIARFLDAIPVITTSSDVHGVFAVDVWAKKCGLKIANPERIKWITARLLAGDNIRIQGNYPIAGHPPAGVTLCDKGGDVLVSHRSRGKEEALRLVPPIITLGVGSKKGASAEALEQAFELMLAKGGCHPLSVIRVCSIDMKANEPGILEFCRRRGLPFQTFSAQQLMGISGSYSSSAFVKQVTGADNVCERSAVLGSGIGGRLLTGKDAGNGITMALAISPYEIHFDEECGL